MSGPTAYFNGAFVSYEQAQLPLHDAGFVWGATITDRVRTFRQQLFRLEAHLARFANSCRLAAVPLEPSLAQLRTIAEEVLERNRLIETPDQEYSLIFLATPGPLATLSPKKIAPQPSLIVYALPINLSRYARHWKYGVPLRTEFALLGTNANIKHRSRLPWWIAQQKVNRVDPHAEPLFINERGDLLETPSANLVLVRDGVLLCPPATEILHGISLDVVHELAAQCDLPVAIRPLTVTDLECSSEALLVNTTYCLANVAKVNDLHLPVPGRVCAQLTNAWSELVGTSIVPVYADAL